MNLNPEEKTVGKENYLSAVEALDKKNQGDFAKSAAANAAAANEPNDANRRKFLKDIVGLGEQHGVAIKTMIRADIAPEDAILRQARLGRHNLIVMGVTRRPAATLTFGKVASAVLDSSDRSVLYVVS